MADLSDEELAKALEATIINPGVLGYISSTPQFEPGYKAIFRNQIVRDPTAAYPDPRGILPGLVPSSTISYELADNVREYATVDNFGIGRQSLPFLAGLGSLAFALLGTNITLSSQTTIAVIVFEGRDIIDLPTANLKSSDGGIEVPDRVFLPIYLGGQFLQPNDNLSAKVAAEYAQKSDGNSIGNVVPSINPPLDCLSNENCIFPKGVIGFPIIDTASKVIKGSGAYISYTSMDKALFRDVVTLNSSTIAQGNFIGNDFQIKVVAPYATPLVQIVRYVLINVSPEGTDPYYQWRMSESFGVGIDKKEDTPTTLSLTGNDLSRSLSDALNSHYVYNLKDLGTQDIKSGIIPPVPNKTGYSPTLAKSLVEKDSTNFLFQEIPTLPNQFFSQSRLQVNKIFGLSGTGKDFVASKTLNKVEIDRSFISPFYNIAMGNNGRIGLEYVMHKFSHSNAFGSDEVTILAKTTPSAPGIASYYDMATGDSVVFNLEETIRERHILDPLWQASGAPVPDSQLKTFLVGEIPYRSSGFTALRPPEVPAGTVGESTISIENTKLITSLIVTSSSDTTNTSIISLFSGTDTTVTPIFEGSIPVIQQTNEAILPVPSLGYKSFKISGEGSLSSLLGVPTADFLPAFSDSGGLGEINKFQLSSLKSQSFPIVSTGVGVGYLPDISKILLAYETDDRIDVAYRNSAGAPFQIYRDIALRISEDFATQDLNETKKNFPPIANPFIIADPGSFLLFYVYKKRVILKTIPYIIFGNDTAEMTLSQTVQNLGGTVVFDGHVNPRNSQILADEKYGTLNIPGETFTSTTATPEIVQYSACKSAGTTVVFIETNNQQIIARKSSDIGMSWEDALPPNFYFMPQTTSGSMHLSDTGEDGQSPYCFTIENDILLFFMYDSALLSMGVPQSMFRETPTNAAEILKDSKPEIIYGKQSDKLKAKGISYDPSVSYRIDKLKDGFNEKINPHRISVVKIGSGHLRLFFLDTDGNLKSLISNNLGQNWDTEEQYVGTL